MDKAILACGLNRHLVEMHGLHRTPFDPRRLRFDQSGAISEILRTIYGPLRDLFTMKRQGLDACGLLAGRELGIREGAGQGSVEMIFSRDEESGRSPQQALSFNRGLP